MDDLPHLTICQTQYVNRLILTYLKETDAGKAFRGEKSIKAY